MRNIIIGVVVLALIGAGTFFLLSNNDENDTSNNSATNESSTTQEQPTEEDSHENGNIYSLTESGSAQKCTFSYSGSNGTGSGTMYSDGAGRGLMTMDLQTSEGKTAESNTLVSSDKVYGWTITDGKSAGFIFDKATLTSQTNTNQDTSGSAGTDPNQNFDLNCDGWTVEENLLTVPEDVNFVTLPTAQ